MALSAELLLYSTGIFLLCQIVFLPAGHLAAAYLGANLSSRIQLLLAYGISLLSFSLFFAAGLWLRISIPTIQILLMSAISVLLGLWIVQKKYAALFQKDAAWFYLVWLLYFVLTLAATAFPRGDFREITAHTSMMLANLPIDNHIPYNFARYIVEHIDPNKLEVVPTWRASDRGPLGGLAAALFFILLGEKEQLPWLLTSPGLYFVCQAVVSFLNLLSLLGVWVLAVELLDRTSARYAVILTGINYFYFLNIFFSWPKFLMAYFLLCALYLWQRLGLRLWAGIFFAGAMLSHDSAAFCLAVSGLLLLYEAAKNAALAIKSGQTVFLHRSREFMRTLLPMGIGFAATMAPWVLYKRFYSPPSPRLLYLHLFCDKDTSTVKSSFCEALRAYLRDNSWNEIIGTRVYNLWYPFDPYPSLIRIRDLWQSPAVLLNHFHMPVFFQFTWGAGGAAFILFLLGLYWL
ncbi:MAG TPA: hypothetical protein PLP17_12585, partial [Oligoflexia bacterium]|nr:hypothetical protein [Oligoflexia bacterium]